MFRVKNTTVVLYTLLGGGNVAPGFVNSKTYSAPCRRRARGDGKKFFFGGVLVSLFLQGGAGWAPTTYGDDGWSFFFCLVGSRIGL